LSDVIEARIVWILRWSLTSVQNPSKWVPCCRYTAIAAALDAATARVSIGEFQFK